MNNQARKLEEEFVIEVDNINLKYSFMSSMNIKNEMLRLLFRRKESRKKQVHALKDVSFKVKKGEVIGIIGGNGAGKSTLLKVLANIYDPDSGDIKIDEKSIFLMSLGAGFKKELSAIDNIYLNGLLLGLKREEISKMIPDIIDFSGVGEFVNNPLQTFSSGMRSRLAFAIACTIKPDILLIDEILSVGDEEFKIKSREKILELINGDRTVIIVSHNLNMIQNTCDRVIWLRKGEIIDFGESDVIVKNYRDYVNQKKRKNMRK